MGAEWGEWWGVGKNGDRIGKMEMSGAEWGEDGAEWGKIEENGESRG